MEELAANGPKLLWELRTSEQLANTLDHHPFLVVRELHLLLESLRQDETL